MGYAGDMLQFAKKHNVRIVRDSSGFREVGLINFTEKTLFTSPYYYLQRNDVLIIEADNNAKKVNERFARVSNAVSIITSIITLIFFVSK